ncbi:MAG: addiction module toxin, HicA family [Syntrophomonadaceae bacterium]|nr:addiction module toxin, HicA family [Syntrophomonadaceae bacterium]
MVKLLIFLGFIQIRQKGSHIFFAHPDGRTTVVPCHNDDLGRGLIRKILRDIDLSVPDYERLKKEL